MSLGIKGICIKVTIRNMSKFSMFAIILILHVKRVTYQKVNSGYQSVVGLRVVFLSLSFLILN